MFNFCLFVQFFLLSITLLNTPLNSFAKCGSLLSTAWTTENIRLRTTHFGAHNLLPAAMDIHQFETRVAEKKEEIWDYPPRPLTPEDLIAANGFASFQSDPNRLDTLRRNFKLDPTQFDPTPYARGAITQLAPPEIPKERSFPVNFRGEGEVTAGYLLIADSHKPFIRTPNKEQQWQEFFRRMKFRIFIDPDLPADIQKKIFDGYFRSVISSVKGENQHSRVELIVFEFPMDHEVLENSIRRAMRPYIAAFQDTPESRELPVQHYSGIHFTDTGMRIMRYRHAP